MEQILAVLSLIVAILIAISTLVWSRRIRQAKEAEISAKEAEISAKKAEIEALERLAFTSVQDVLESRIKALRSELQEVADAEASRSEAHEERAKLEARIRALEFERDLDRILPKLLSEKKK